MPTTAFLKDEFPPKFERSVLHVATVGHPVRSLSQLSLAPENRYHGVPDSNRQRSVVLIGTILSSRKPIMVLEASANEGTSLLEALEQSAGQPKTRPFRERAMPVGSVYTISYTDAVVAVYDHDREQAGGLP